MRQPLVRRASDKTLMDFAHLLADDASKATLAHFRKAIDVANKDSGGYDPVTEGDRAAERAMVRRITRSHPDHGVLGEEFGSRNETAALRWVLDPIDGTRAFIMGQPLWGTLIGLLEGDQPVLGLMSQPFTEERFWGTSAGAFWRRGTAPARRLKTRTGGKLADAILTATTPDMFTSADFAAFNRVGAAARMTRFGGDCYNYCLLAAGFIDVVAETGLKPYDIVALIPIIEKAGGVVTTWDGKPATSGGRIVACGDKRVHDEVLKLLARG
jgi:histidinol phosphatase-like enzyme (inositol monophosphatase family)